MNAAKLSQIRRYAVQVADDHRDDIGDVILTHVEEDVQDHFGLTDQQFSDCDISYITWEALSAASLIS
jgi:hypothetical protein